MKKLILAFFISSLVSQAFGDNVIVHPSNTASLDEKSISRIFLGKAKSFPGGGQAVPITLEDATADTFSKKVLNKSPVQLKAYWSKLLFTGKGQPPRVVKNDAEMIELVAANPNMIGFISGEGDGTVKVVSSF